MKWNTLEHHVERVEDPLDSMADHELMDLLDEISKPKIEEWVDGSLILEKPEPFDDPYDLEHQIMDKLTERDFQPEADVIADKVIEKLDRDLIKSEDFWFNYSNDGKRR